MNKKQKIEFAVEHAKTVKLVEQYKTIFSPALHEALSKWLVTIGSFNKAIQITFIDTTGSSASYALGDGRAKALLTSLQDLVQDHATNTYTKDKAIQDTLSLVLLIRENGKNVGPMLAKSFKQMLDGCSRKDSIIISIMQDVIEQGIKQYDKTFFSQSSGHTIYSKEKLISTIVNKYSTPVPGTNFKEYDEAITLSEAIDTCKFLIRANLITSIADDKYCAMHDVYRIEYDLLQLSKEDSELDIDMDLTGLNDGQRDMLTNFLKGKRIVCGNAAAGTGKTFSISRLIQGSINAGLTVLVAAPTGNAAMVLNGALKDLNIDTSKLIGGAVITIDRANAVLEYVDSFEADVVVIDEASMISTEHLKLFGLLANKPTKIILLGDIMQINPVGIGAPFIDLCNRNGFSTLSENMRANNDTQKTKLLNILDGKGYIDIPLSFSGIERQSKDDILKYVSSDEYKSKRDFFHQILTTSMQKEIQWLAYTNNLTNALAQYYIGMLLGSPDMDMRLGDIISTYFGTASEKPKAKQLSYTDYVGLKVVWTANRYDSDDMRVYRGYVGTVKDNGVVEFVSTSKSGDVGKLLITYEDCEGKIMPTITRTVNRAQGQSIEDVIYLVKVTKYHYRQPIFDKNVFYTAVSRAKSRSFVVSLMHSAKQEIKLTSQTARDTLLSLVKKN